MMRKKIDSRAILSFLWLPFGATLLTLSVILWGTLIIICGNIGLTGKTMKFLVRSWVTLVPKYFFIRHRVFYPPNFDQEYSIDEPLIVVSNHQSFFDIPGAYLALKGNIRMLSKESLFKVPVFGHAMKAAGHVEIVRGNRTSGRMALEALRKRLSSGIQIWIAPEGTRSLDWKMGNFKAGSFSLSLDLDLPIQPMVMMNAFEIMGRGRLIPQVGSCLEIQVLPRILPKQLGLNDRVALSQYVWEQMNRALETYWNQRSR